MERRVKVNQFQEERINEFPVDILDNIMGFLPIKDATRTAVLSRGWRDTWFNLTQLKFDDCFFEHMKKKYMQHWTTAGLHVIHKVLMQHNGSINKFILSFPEDRITNDPPTIRSRSFDFDQWFLRITRKGVKELHLTLNPEYDLPNCIYSCPTLKKLFLRGVSFELPHVSPILPNVTSLCFEQVEFLNFPPHPTIVPMLENLSFTLCTDISLFKITAPKLHTLRINSCISEWNFKMIPVNLDLIRFVHTLDLDYFSLEVYMYIYSFYLQ